MLLFLLFLLILAGLLLAAWVRASFAKQASRSIMLGIIFQVFTLSLVVFLLETKRKGGEALWRHRVGTTLVATANALNSASNAKNVQSLIFTALKGDTKINFAQLQELSVALSALEVSSNSNTKTFKPSTTSDLQWLTGKWLVSERFIAKHRNYFERYEAYDTLTIDKDSILQSRNYKTGWVVLADITYRKAASSGRSLELEVNDGKVFVNHPPDVYYFKVPSFEETNWFIWEHSISGDILVFRRDKMNCQ